MMGGMREGVYYGCITGRQETLEEVDGSTLRGTSRAIKVCHSHGQHGQVIRCVTGKGAWVLWD